MIDLPSFYMDMEGARRGVPISRAPPATSASILEDFKAKGVDAVVLDLRRNGGGTLTEAINLTGLFIDDGPVVQVKDADGRVQQYDDTERGMAWTGPLVVLISKFSASASEILAGAIQDYRRGLIVGDTSTHGKGTVQSLLDLGQQLFRIPNPPNLGALKITMQQFYRPNGDSTQKRGVLADVELPSITDHLDVAEADLDYPSSSTACRPPATTAKHGHAGNRPALATLASPGRPVGGVRQAAAQHRALQDAEGEEAGHAQRRQVLRRTGGNGRRQGRREAAGRTQPAERPTIKRDYYLNEVLAITADYVRLLQQAKVAQAR